MVPRAWGRGSFDAMQAGLGLEQAAWKQYPGMGHSACDEELADVAAFLKAAFEK